jgi:hypothetical protein
MYERIEKMLTKPVNKLTTMFAVKNCDNNNTID